MEDKMELGVTVIWDSDEIVKIIEQGEEDIYFFFQAEVGIRDKLVTGVQTCALPIWKKLLMSQTESMKASRPCSGSARKVPPGMMIIQSVFQTERPMSRESVMAWLGSKNPPS